MLSLFSRSGAVTKTAPETCDSVRILLFTEAVRTHGRFLSPASLFISLAFSLTASVIFAPPSSLASSSTISASASGRIVVVVRPSAAVFAIS